MHFVGADARTFKTLWFTKQTHRTSRNFGRSQPRDRVPQSAWSEELSRVVLASPAGCFGSFTFYCMPTKPGCRDRRAGRYTFAVFAKLRCLPVKHPLPGTQKQNKRRNRVPLNWRALHNTGTLLWLLVGSVTRGLSVGSLCDGTCDKISPRRVCTGVAPEDQRRDRETCSSSETKPSVVRQHSCQPKQSRLDDQ